MKEFVKAKLDGHPELRKFAKGVYVSAGKFGSAILRIPILGMLIRAVVSLLRMPFDVARLKRQMKDVYPVAEYAPTLLHTIEAVEANIRRGERVDKEQWEAISKLRDRLDSLLKEQASS